MCIRDSYKLEQVWDEQRKILWDQLDIVGRETNTDKRKIIESSFMAVNNNCIGQTGKDVSRVRIKNEKEYVCRGEPG